MRIEANTAPKDGMYKGIGTDSTDYPVLYDAAQAIKGVEGFTCELGVYYGGSSALIVQACIDNDDPRIHVGIDPYGNIEFADPRGAPDDKVRGYPNSIKHSALPDLFKFFSIKQVEFLFFNMEAAEFFQRFADGIPVYNQCKTIINSYALVHFDTPASMDGSTKIAEAEFFQSRTPVGGIWVFDDVGTGTKGEGGWYHHENVHARMCDWGFELLTKAWKWSYRKVRQPA